VVVIGPAAGRRLGYVPGNLVDALGEVSHGVANLLSGVANRLSQWVLARRSDGCVGSSTPVGGFMLPRQMPNRGRCRSAVVAAADVSDVAAGVADWRYADRKRRRTSQVSRVHKTRFKIDTRPRGEGSIALLAVSYRSPWVAVPVRRWPRETDGAIPARNDPDSSMIDAWRPTTQT
jgi:hypothetical protein